MKNLILGGAVLIAFSTLSVTSYAAEETKLISAQDALQTALAELGIEILGIRFDEPDTQWDVFIRLDEQAYEVEVDAVSGKIVAAEKESLKEIQAELAGDLSHEGVDGDVDK